MQEYEYKFSVIMPVYNTELYLEEAIESVIFQSIGYRDNIQLILIDDGSTDGSGIICDEYARRYPHNVFVIHQSNSGVSAARNKGIELIKGEYVAFVDSDDKISYNAMEAVCEFFDNHNGEIDFISIPFEFFDGDKGEHILNYKFKTGSRVIDLRKEYNCIQCGIGGVFVKSEILQGRRFNTELPISEDADLIMRILMENPRYGVVTNVKYFYRRRTEGEISLSSDLQMKEHYYLPNLKNFLYPIINYSIQKFNYIPRFVQFTVMYYVQWMYSIDLEVVKIFLNDEEIKEYLSLLYGLLKYIDDEIILGQRSIQIEEKAVLIAKKNDTEVGLKTIEDADVEFSALPNSNVLNNFKTEVVSNGHTFIELRRCKNVLEFIRIRNDKLTLEGYTTFMGIDESDDVKIYLVIDDEKFFLCEINSKRDNSKKRLGEVVLLSLTYSGEIENISRYGNFELKIYTEINGLCMERTDLRFGKFFPVVKNFGRAYAWIEKWMVRVRANKLEFSVPTDQQILFQEESLLREIAYVKTPEAMHAVERRRRYHALKAGQEKDVWVMSDRINKGGDNAEALFQYIGKEQKEGQNAYFVLRTDSADYPIVSKFGPVLDYYSDDHLMKHLLSDVVISGHFDEYIRNPFFEEIVYYQDLIYHKQQVYLQHGVLKDDFTKLTNRYVRDFSLITTSAERERNEMLTEDYFYDDRVLKLTGMPRFDPLARGQEKKEIVIAPSWRIYLTVAADCRKDGRREAAYGFKDSDYFRFYNGLINDTRLLEAAKEAGYTISFMPHPNIIPFIDMFDQHEGVKFYSIDKRYYEMLSEAKLLVTDYSGVAFDFAYLDKPVVYCHFDFEEFYAHHTCKQAYYNYKQDGFGEVEYNLEDTVQCLIDYINNDCRLKEKYQQRINNFFAFRDHNSSARVYKEIQHLSEYVDRNEERMHSHILSDKNNWLQLMDKVRNLPADPHGVLVYRFPYELFSENDRVVLYGFGAIGATFYWQNQQYTFCDIVACVDRNADKEAFPSVPLIRLEELGEQVYDYILIAITNKKVAMDIKDVLLNMGVKEEAIKWAGNQYEMRVDEKRI